MKHGPVGLRARDHGRRDGQGRPATRPRSEVYKRLGLAYIEPELREGRGEIKAAANGELPELVERRATSAATCTATRRSPTARTRSRRWPRRRRARGYAYLAITDHSASHGFGDNVTPERCCERIEEIAEMNDRAATGTLPRPRRLGGQHPPRRWLDYERRAARAARLGRRQRPHLVPDDRRRR